MNFRIEPAGSAGRIERMPAEARHKRVKWPLRWLGLAAAAMLLLAPSSALAQKGKGKGKPTTPAPTGAGGGAGGATPAPAGGGADELDQPTTPPGTGPAVPVGPAGDNGGGICDVDPTAPGCECKLHPDAPACKAGDVGEASKRKVKADLYAVEQLYVIKRNRLEVMPYYGFTLNDQFVGHNAPGLSLNYYLTNVLAIGLNGNLYAGQNSDSDFNFQNRRATRVAVPLNEYQWSAAFDFTYVPVYGKFAGFSNFIFSYDIFVDGGVGAISTRPIAVIDPDNRKFDFAPKIAFNLGIGLRIFLTKWLAATLMIADYIYPEKLENLKINGGAVGSTTDPNSPSNPNGKVPWLDDGVSVTNNVQAQVGISVFLPFSFNYRLPK